MKTRSLTRTLMVGVLLAELACAALFSALSYAHEMSGREHAFDVMLHGRADSVLGAVQDAEDRDDNVIVDQSELPLPNEDVYEVMMASGRVVGRSPGTSSVVFNAIQGKQSIGYFNFKVNGEHYRAIRQLGLRVIDREEQAGGLRRPVTIVYAAPTSHLWHEAVEAIRFYVIAGCLLLLLTWIAITWFLRHSLSPLRELAARAERVSTEAWEFEAPREAMRMVELQPIAVSIQKLLLGLRAAFDRQRQFTGDAAHELKTSISVLKSSLQLITMKDRTAQDYRHGIEGLMMDVQRMEELTNRMLTLARIEQAPVEAAARCDLSSAVSLVATRLEPVASLKGVSIAISSAARSSVAMDIHDADLLCSNLLINAVQYSVAGSTISVGTREHGGRVVLLVSDEGVGIPEDSIPNLFTRFYRGDASRSRENGGVGLGLAICKAITSRSGGAIAIESRMGHGTAVRVTLPIADPRS